VCYSSISRRIATNRTRVQYADDAQQHRKRSAAYAFDDDEAGCYARHTPILNDNATKQNQYIEPRRDDFLAIFFTGFLATFLAAFDFLPYINEPSCHQPEPESATTQP